MWPSPTEIIDHGDIEAACVDILRNFPLLLEFDPEVQTDLTGIDLNNPSVRAIILSREGGPQQFPVDYPRVDINAYAHNRSDAWDMAKLARARLFASAGYRGFGLTITAAQEEVGIVKSSDKETGCPRYFCSLRLTTRSSSDES